MKIDSILGDDAVLAELGRRLAEQRLQRNLSQAELAERAGVGVATVERLERGSPVALTTFIRVLRELDLLEALERLVPEPLPSPREQLRLHGRRRQRAGRSRGGTGTAERTDEGRERDRAATL